MWDEQEGSVVSGGGGLCVTLGSPNFEGGSDYDVHASSGRGQRPQWQGNNGTLEHEVWRGPLSDSFGTPGAARGVFREVVVLFNKGETAETISTTVGPCTGAATKCTARDVVAKKALGCLYTCCFLFGAIARSAISFCGVPISTGAGLPRGAG